LAFWKWDSGRVDRPPFRQWIIHKEAEMMNGLFLMVALVAGSPELQLTECEQNMLANVNAERTRRGLNVLVIDESLQIATRNHAIRMATTHRMWHPENCGCENVANSQPNCHEAHRTWMNSSGHRANILRGGVTKIGVAGYVSVNGRHYWCMRVSR